MVGFTQPDCSNVSAKNTTSTLFVPATTQSTSISATILLSFSYDKGSSSSGGGWLPAIQRRFRLQQRTSDLLRFQRRYGRAPIQLPAPSLSAPRVLYTSSAPWSLSSHYESGPSGVLSNSDPTALSSSARDYPIVIDTGASVSVSPNLSDFINGVQTDHLPELRGLNHQTKVAGMGMVEWSIFDVNNRVQTLRTWAFYVPDATIRLFSPQTFFQEQGGGELVCTQDTTTLSLSDGTSLVFPYNRDTNLPFMLPTSNRMPNVNQECVNNGRHVVGLDDNDINLFSAPDELFELMTVADETNQNSSKSQKELLQWHWKLGHCNFQWIQALAA